MIHSFIAMDGESRRTPVIFSSHLSPFLASRSPQSPLLTIGLTAWDSASSTHARARAHTHTHNSFSPQHSCLWRDPRQSEQLQIIWKVRRATASARSGFRRNGGVPGEFHAAYFPAAYLPVIGGGGTMTPASEASFPSSSSATRECSFFERSSTDHGGGAQKRGSNPILLACRQTIHVRGTSSGHRGDVGEDTKRTEKCLCGQILP